MISQSATARYAVAVVVSIVTPVLSTLLGPVVDPTGFPLFLGAVMLSAWYGGLGPGLLATVAGAVSGGVLLPAVAWAPAARLETVVRFGLYLLEALVITSLAAALRGAQARAEALAASEQATRAEVEAAAQKLRDLQTVTDAALAHLRLDDLLRELIGRIREALAADTVVILLLGEDGRELFVRAAHGLEEEVAGDVRVPVGRGIAGRIATRREPMVVEDLSAVEIVSPILRRKGLHALLGTPLMVEGRVIGVVHVGTLGPRRFTADEARLLQLVADRIAIAIENARLYGAEQAARAERKREAEIRATLLDRVITAQEEEQRRIARELHDETGQTLTSLVIGLRAVQEAPTVEAARDQAAELRRIAARALAEVRRFAWGLRPSALDELGLVAALEHSAAQYAQVRGITIHVEARGLDADRLPAAVETSLYRIVQEALANAVKHAKPQTVSIVIQRQGAAVQAIVADDGSGFDVHAALGARGVWTRLGLHGMRERAALLNGSVTIESTPGEGTTVYASIPLGAQGAAADGADPDPHRG